MKSVKLYTIDWNDEHIGPITYKWMTKAEIVPVWLDRAEWAKKQQHIRSKLFFPAEIVNHRGGFSATWFTDAAIDKLTLAVRSE